MLTQWLEIKARGCAAGMYISSIKLYNRFRVCMPLSLSHAVLLVWFRVQFGKKHARVSFSKTSKAFLKNSRMHIFPKLHEKSNYYLAVI